MVRTEKYPGDPTAGTAAGFPFLLSVVGKRKRQRQEWDLEE